MGGYVENLRLGFVDKNRSQLVHTLSINAEYTPLDGLLKRKMFLPKVKKKKSFTIFSFTMGNYCSTVLS